MEQLHTCAGAVQKYIHGTVGGVHRQTAHHQTERVYTFTHITSNNRHIYVSPSIHVESIAPGSGIRYTAMIKADSKLRAGNANFALTVLLDKKSISKVTEFKIPTRK